MSDDLTMLRRLVATAERTDELEAELKLAKRAYKDTEELVWDHMDAAKRDSDIRDLGVPYGRVQFTKQETVRGSIIAGQKAVARASLAAMGLEDVMFDELGVLRQKVLNDHVKDWLRDGTPFPDGITFFTTRYVTITKKPDRGGTP